jgi:hypothetical protein
VEVGQKWRCILEKCRREGRLTNAALTIGRQIVVSRSIASCSTIERVGPAVKEKFGNIDNKVGQ